MSVHCIRLSRVPSVMDANFFLDPSGPSKKRVDGQKFSRQILPVAFAKGTDQPPRQILTDSQRKQINMLRNTMIPSLLCEAEPSVEWICLLCAQNNRTKSAPDLGRVSVRSQKKQGNACSICGRPRGYVSTKKALQPGYVNPRKAFHPRVLELLVGGKIGSHVIFLKLNHQALRDKVSSKKRNALLAQYIIGVMA